MLLYVLPRSAFALQGYSWIVVTETLLAHKATTVFYLVLQAKKNTTTLTQMKFIFCSQKKSWFVLRFPGYLSFMWSLRELVWWLLCYLQHVAFKTALLFLSKMKERPQKTRWDYLRCQASICLKIPSHSFGWKSTTSQSRCKGRWSKYPTFVNRKRIMLNK